MRLNIIQTLQKQKTGCTPKCIQNRTCIKFKSGEILWEKSVKTPPVRRRGIAFPSSGNPETHLGNVNMNAKCTMCAFSLGVF